MTAAVSAIALAGVSGVDRASAGDYNGDFMVRLQGTYLLTDDDRKSIDADGIDATALADTSTTNQFLPTATLTYFFTKNLSAELLCCFATSSVKVSDTGLGAALGGLGIGTGAAINGEVGKTWMFPPALTLQYHFDGLGAVKPYLGVGAQWIHFFSEKTGNNVLGASKIELDDAFGIVLQAGVDIAIGNGWYLNADVKKSFLDTEVTLHNVAGGAINRVTVDHDLDPWIFSVGVGYRFNLLGGRDAPLK
jgi:outer membrane protein